MSNLKIHYYSSPRNASTKKNVRKCSWTLKKIISVTRKDLLWGALYANKENKLSSSIESRIQKDLSTIDYYFDCSGPYLKINHDLNYLDQTSKTFDSYKIGMILCNVVAKKLFDVKHLHHFIHFLGAKISTKKSRKSPDFIASNKNGFYIFESKGTLGSSTVKFDKKAVEQLNSVKSVNGHRPYKFIISFFNNNDIAEVDVVDPNDEGLFDIQYNSNYPVFGYEQEKIFNKKLFLNNSCYFCVESSDFIVGYSNNNYNDDISYSTKSETYHLYSDGTIIIEKRPNKILLNSFNKI